MLLREVPIKELIHISTRYPELGSAVLSGLYVCPSGNNPLMSGKLDLNGISIGFAMRKKGSKIPDPKSLNIAGDGLLVDSVRFPISRDGRVLLTLTVCLLTDAVSVNIHNATPRILAAIPSICAIPPDQVFQLAMMHGSKYSSSAAFIANAIFSNDSLTVENNFTKLPKEILHTSLQQLFLTGLNSRELHRISGKDKQNKLVCELRIPIMAVFAGFMVLEVGNKRYLKVFGSQADTFPFIDGVSLGFDRHMTVQSHGGDNLSVKLSLNTSSQVGYSSIGLLPPGRSNRPDAMIVKDLLPEKDGPRQEVLLITDGALHGNVMYENHHKTGLGHPVDMAEIIASQVFCKDDASMVAINV